MAQPPFGGPPGGAGYDQGAYQFGRAARRPGAGRGGSKRNLFLIGGGVGLVVVAVAVYMFMFAFTSSAPSPTTVYSANGVSFQAAFPAEPVVQVGGSGLLSGDPKGTAATGFGVSPDVKQLFSNSTTAPKAPSFAVVVVNYPSASNVRRDLQAASFFTSQGFSHVTVNGYQGIEGVVQEKHFPGAKEFPDPNAYFGLQVVGSGTHEISVLSVSDNRSDVQAFLDSFHITG